MQTNKIDILMLIDTRVDKDKSKYLSAQARDLLGQGCYVASHPVAPTAPMQKSKSVGGQMILALPSWGGAIIKSQTDRT